MAKAIMTFTISKPNIHSSMIQTPKLDSKVLRQCSSLKFYRGWNQIESNKRKAANMSKVNAFPDFHLMAVMVQPEEYGRNLVTTKYIMHMSDETIMNIYVLYIFFTCWGCLFFGSMKDPYYDSEVYRKDGGDGTGNWLYEAQDDIEEKARAALWREELIEEIEQKVGGLRELEEAGRK